MTDNAKELLALAELRTANETRQREWDTLGQLTLAYRGNELAGEVGEACNVIKKLERERLGIAGSRDSTAHLAEELADVIICTDLIAMQAGIDLGAAVVAKFNASSEKVGLRTRLSARQQASVEEVARMLCHADGNDPDSVETFGIRTIRHGRRTDTGHDDRHGHREDCTSWPLWRGYKPIARALLAKYDIFQKVEG